MILTIDLCSYCESSVGFYRCDTGKIILMCDECNVVWEDPTKIKNGLGIAIHSSKIPELGCSLIGNNAGWAEYEELPEAWCPYIDPDSCPYQNKSTLKHS